MPISFLILRPSRFQVTSPTRDRFNEHIGRAGAPENCQLLQFVVLAKVALHCITDQSAKPARDCDVLKRSFPIVLLRGDMFFFSVFPPHGFPLQFSQVSLLSAPRGKKTHFESLDAFSDGQTAVTGFLETRRSYWLIYQIALQPSAHRD